MWQGYLVSEMILTSFCTTLSAFQACSFIPQSFKLTAPIRVSQSHCQFYVSVSQVDKVEWSAMYWQLDFGNTKKSSSTARFFWPRQKNPVSDTNFTTGFAAPAGWNLSITRLLSSCPFMLPSYDENPIWRG